MAETADAAIRRRFRATCAQLERFGADEDTAQLVSSIVQHLEQPRTVGVGIGVERRGQGRVEPHELAALSGVITLVLRNMAERAAREEALAEAIA